MRSPGWAMIQYDCCPYKKRQDTDTCRARDKHTRTLGRNGIYKLRARPQGEPILPTSGSWTSSFQNRKKTHLGPPVCGASSRQS